MEPTKIEMIATILFALAVLHTFLVSKFEHLAHKYETGSVGENFFHFLAEVEVVFGIWAAIFIGFFSYFNGFAIYDEQHVHVIGGAVHYLNSLNYTEPAFVFVVMSIAGTRPVLLFATNIIKSIAKVMPLPQKMAFYMTALIVGPILGSLITEPAAMTVTAIILLKYFYNNKMSNSFKYTTIGLLFVNISIGGTLTHFAAPPVLMVATKWHWDTVFMLINFGYKAVIAVIISTLIMTFRYRKELVGKLVEPEVKDKTKLKPTWIITLIHLIFIALVVYSAHHMIFFLGLFLFFLGFVAVTKEYQDEVKIKESLLVGFFLAGLVTLGNQQAWWLKEVLAQLSDLPLFIGSILLTGITDNAALTYLGSLVELSDSAKYNLVAGAVTGGGLTVIANAPNPAGFGILKDSFGEDGIHPLKLLFSALIPTAIAAVLFQILH